MKPQRTIGVVIPCFDDTVLLRRCLTAFARQTTPPDEIVVVDNGSADDSAAVAAEFGARVVDEPRRGITWATRTGFDASACDVKLRTDADVRPAPEFVEKLHAAWDDADANPGPAHCQREVVGVTGSGRFEPPGMWGRLTTAMYLGAYRASVGAALGHQPFFGANFAPSAVPGGRTCAAASISPTSRSTRTCTCPSPSGPTRPCGCSRIWRSPWIRALVGARQVLRRFRRGAHTIAVNRRDETSPQRLGARGLLPAAMTR